MTGEVDDVSKRDHQLRDSTQAADANEMNNTGDAGSATGRENDDVMLLDEGYMYRNANGVFKNSEILKELTGYRDDLPEVVEKAEIGVQTCIQHEV